MSTSTPQVKPSQILRRACEVIDTPEKWCKGTGRPRVCATNAVVDATEAFGLNGSGLERFAAIGAIDTGGASLPRWNDAPERTHAEVLAAMTKAAEALEARGE